MGDVTDLNQYREEIESQIQEARLIMSRAVVPVVEIADDGEEIHHHIKVDDLTAFANDVTKRHLLTDTQLQMITQFFLTVYFGVEDE